MTITEVVAIPESGGGGYGVAATALLTVTRTGLGSTTTIWRKAAAQTLRYLFGYR
jgi:hypothetical protein